MEILLIEPDYKNKYSPLGLMKISTYHKNNGDSVTFFKGCSLTIRKQKWDRIYIATLFTFYWNKTIKTINYYKDSVNDFQNIFVGGILATLMKNEILNEIKVSVVIGLLNESGKIGFDDDHIIDSLVPDYSIIDPDKNLYLNYSYPTNNSYIVHATRGCTRKCKFCAVPIIEPNFTNGLSIEKQVNKIKENFGEKRHLLLLDNNILASDCFFDIIEEIKELGFYKGAKFHTVKNGKKYSLVRFVDFNQGLDARKLTEKKMKVISELAINPLRIAFDNIRLKDLYIKKVRLAAKYSIKILSNYILYNYKDTPVDLYERLKINIELNEAFIQEGFNSRIWSFPMKYSPILGKDNTNRNYVGKAWNKKQLRGIQCILNATHGVVGPKKHFFEKAFGKNVEEFKKIIMMPEIYIINRYAYEEDAKLLEKKIESLATNTKGELIYLINQNNFKIPEKLTKNKKLQSILNIYTDNSTQFEVHFTF